ncbi:rhamnogalacturonan endolyase [Filimonas lacunae]|uniref:Rhamnogalacturonan endolyase n=1 Tax=Filimonas lacunae TaxID=477680 RepID=A0A173MN32_9BACT|nr:RICIN domain-containing protein [Filimonas lacunae]BAV08860.1 rhamnogalacturonan lyase in rhamnose utilization cluster [Filimonas lacunae]SIS62932.1 rhamnogalacturonan endolyase [Filimonas lacunae]
MKVNIYFLPKGKSCMGVCTTLLFFITLLFSNSMYAQKQMEKLGRGVVAVRTSSSQVYVGWRLLGTDPSTISFNVYRGTTKLNSTPITTSTNYVDNVTTNGSYTIKPVISGVEQAASAAASVTTTSYLSVPITAPAGGTTPDGVAYTYSANDASVADLDGDGEYEIVLKWDPSNSKDNSQSGYTGNVFLDAYKLNGTRLWRIDLGRNIRAGAHYTQFQVYDLDGDGKAEVACKTADATIDGVGTVIGSSTADYRNTSGYVLSGPEYLTIFNGLTGAAMATTNYLPARGTVSSWGDSYGNRVDRFVANVAYLDGQRPSLVMGRGYYTRLVRVAWDWRNGTLTQRWTFDSNTSGNSAYAGQGNHQVTVGDVDGDGKDEVVNGSSAINDNGTGLYANGLGHGDAMHMSDMDPDRPGQEVWQCHETPSQYGVYGLEFRDANTGTPLWGVAATTDVGRALAADIDPRYKGYECWGTAGYLYDCKGNQIGTTRPSVNHVVWWDADLQRELLDGVNLDKWVYASNTSSRIKTLSDAANGSGASNNSTKANPCVTADILGDWREEIILRNSTSTALNIYTTTIVATNRFYTLMHDPQYRVAVAWQNTAYNQPPHPSFYLGEGMAAPPTPNIYTPGTTNTELVSGAVYNITARHSGLNLDLLAASTANNAAVVQNAVSATSTSQRWTVTATDNGYYQLTAVHSSKNMDITGKSTADAIGVIQYNPSTATNQQFAVIPVGGGYFELSPRHSGKCIEIANASTATNALAQQYTCSGATHQQFKFTPVTTTALAAKVATEDASIAVTVTPNPTNSTFLIKCKGAFSFTLFDMAGRLQESGKGTDQAEAGGRVAPGTYIIKVAGAKNKQSIKVLKL